MKSLNNNRMKTLTTRSIGILSIILSASTILGLWQPLLAKTAPTLQSKPRIEVCFVLDTTGSMGGLIEGAKQKIWSIANEMISAQPTPELKLGLIGYRDRGDVWASARVPGRWRWRYPRERERSPCRSNSQDAVEQRHQSAEDHLSR